MFPDKTMQQVISGSVDIGFCGPEQVIYINNQGKEDYPVLFAQLTQCDGSFLVGREESKDFSWNDLKGKAVIGGRPGGVPEMAFEYVLRQNGLIPGEDVELITNVDFTATAGAFKAGTGDYVTLFEPTASSLVKDGGGYIVASIGESAGYIPYTCFFTTKSFMDKNSDLLEKFTRAIYKGQLWVDKHTNEEIAEKVIKFFPGMEKDILTSSIASYKSIDAYATTPILTEEGLNNLMNIIESYNPELLPARPEFGKIVNNSFSEKIVNEYK